MKDLHLIALCNMLYKIVTKLLTNRLKSILSTTISEFQSVIVPGLYITNNVLVAFEVLHRMKRKNRGIEGEVALKLDISNAYDRVDWRYLKNRMQKMGFSSTWIKWMLLCVTTVSYKFCFHGSSIGPVVSKRRLRQDDPPSPYLFLLCVEGLSIFISKVVNSGRLHGCMISPSAPFVSHLLFANDGFLFFRSMRDESLAVKEILNVYKQQSGQSINFVRHLFWC